MNQTKTHTRIRLILSFFFVLVGNFLFAQTFSHQHPLHQHDEKCAAVYIEEKQQRELGPYGTRDYFERWISDKSEEIKRQPFRFRTQAGEKRLIPVVVHVIHHGTPIGDGANIPFEQIQAQIDVLNQDYGMSNPDANLTPDEFKAVAGNANIEFVLAKQDPNGLPTNGVNRVVGPKDTYTPDDGALIGQLALWAPEEYLNIWVVPLQSPYLGYSSFPISELPGLNFPENTRETDGVTIHYRVFGEGGNAMSTSRGRTATHELGHYFGLRHIWGDASSCDIDDFVEDTPPQSQSNNSCLTTPRMSCGSRDMVENFMDYTPDQCMSLFTIGQVERIDVVLNFSPRRASLINGRATQAPILESNDLAIESIIDPQDYVCGTEITPQVAILNIGENRVTSARATITLNGNVLQTQDFSLDLASGERGVLTFNSLELPTANNNHFEVEIVRVNGTADPDPSDNYVESFPKLQPTLGIPYSYRPADFTNSWTLKNPDGEMSWEPFSLTIDGGSQQGIYMNGYNYEKQGELDYFISPTVNLAEYSDAQLVFKMAYAPYGNRDFHEGLLIGVSTDCGNTFELLEAPYFKSDSLLETVEETFDEFYPTDESQFRTELVNLSEFSGFGEVRVAFISVNGYGNNLFIKDIEILASEEYKYDFEIERLASPGPFVDGTQGEEVLEITNTGNLSIDGFLVYRNSNGFSDENFVVKGQSMAPEENVTYSMPSSLSEGYNIVEYGIIYPNFDQNGGNDDRLIRYFIQDDSTVQAPWRQDFEDEEDIFAWLNLNPEYEDSAWERLALNSGEGSNHVLGLRNMYPGNSYWFGSPLFELNETNQASVFFDWRADGFSSSDRTVFSVLITKDGGSTYEELWSRASGELNAESQPAESKTDEGFVREYIDLSAYAGKDTRSLRLAFKVEHQGGNSSPIYLDNVELFLSANPDPVDPGTGHSIIYPNPATDFFNVSFNLKEYEEVNIQFISSSGQVVHDLDYPNTLNQTYTFSTALLSKGVFIVRITSNSLSETKRLIVQ